MATEVIAVFDIGKTNKKFFLFDLDFKEVHRDYTYLQPIKDEDGHPTENLTELQNWIKNSFHDILKSKDYKVKAVNFSSYGASLVHLDDMGNVITPLYNYTKPISEEVIAKFYGEYGPEIEFCRETGTTREGMLNSGIQLYWLKKEKPEVFSNIKYSLHLPQYLSYLFTGIPVSEYTSIGCHTALWNYEKQDYHNWVYQEEIHKVLPSIVDTGTSINTNLLGHQIKVGVGIHDSSSALLPYIRSIDKKFLLLSTGTWSIALNPFSKELLTDKDTSSNCINYMRINGESVKAARLFLGNEYDEKIKELAKLFNVSEDHHESVGFNPELYQKLKCNFTHTFKWTSIDVKLPNTLTPMNFDSYEEAYHQLMMELVELQVDRIKRAIGNDEINQLYIDGGFANNEIFVELLAHGFDNMKVKTTDASLGSALGAAIVISNVELDQKFLKNNYALKKHRPLFTN
ncbi:FGGY-family carbohydrate kinase [Flagellimonas halotolerans]|uniref:FGGY family carbohydrate kinase n=1 Tax=Flagellimonas halotolerans TaxID=3112164 RepID=A0ABU6IRH5_9FLAO|nr:MULTISPECIES: FGGY family carbohydrate kinase [unclassified Allomuricauda]MEC3965863.1 FGGY family carbohydrate kinase [Muricauda sp. SYSU M86414]MEC4265671.1 FGGY family carbohydrate kinase [Muricauda sp. SYSU M84420]